MFWHPPFSPCHFSRGNVACSAGSVSPVCLGGGRANYFYLFPQTFSVFRLRALLELFLLSPSLGVTSVPGMGDGLGALGIYPHLLLANCPQAWLKPGVFMLGVHEILLSLPRKHLGKEQG